MRRLILFRHAKSDWTGIGRSDHDRPLAARGIDAAPRMADWLKRHYGTPETIVCSTSRRTGETLDLALSTWNTKPDIRYEKNLYHACENHLFSAIASIDDAFERAMIIGHNPGLQFLAMALAKSEDRSQTQIKIGKFPTAAMAIFDLSCESWVDVAPGTGDLVGFMRPKSLA